MFYAYERYHTDGQSFFFSRASILVTQQIHVWLRENRFCLMLESMILASVTLCDDVVTLPYVYMRFWNI